VYCEHGRPVVGWIRSVAPAIIAQNDGDRECSAGLGATGARRQPASQSIHATNPAPSAEANAISNHPAPAPWRDVEVQDLDNSRVRAASMALGSGGVPAASSSAPRGAAAGSGASTLSQVRPWSMSLRSCSIVLRFKMVDPCYVLFDRNTVACDWVPRRSERGGAGHLTSQSGHSLVCNGGTSGRQASRQSALSRSSAALGPSLPDS
jgi:hypothetical protein